jgi:hypothetical protein
MHHFIPIILFTLVSLAGYGQTMTCTGNLGDNIFAQGDFGRGGDIVVQTNPNIAPGFIYSTIVPFDDGRYTITNNMGLWPNNFPTWLEISDNSSDPLGYMMVVNATFAPGIFYQQNIDGLCDNTVYEFTADVINIVKSNVANHILPNVSFLIDQVERFTTGAIPQNETWKTYGFTFTTQPGQEQLTLTLRNNAPGGIGNDLALDNISFRPCGPMASIDISADGRVCENLLHPTLSAIIESDTGSIQWQISTDVEEDVLFRDRAPPYRHVAQRAGDAADVRQADDPGAEQQVRPGARALRLSASLRAERAGQVAARGSEGRLTTVAARRPGLRGGRS